MDWNNNDKFDIWEDEDLFEKISSPSSDVDSCGCVIGLVIGLVVFILFAIVVSSCNKESDTEIYHSSYSYNDYTTKDYTTSPYKTYSNNSPYNSHKSYKSPAKSYSDYDEYDAKSYSDYDEYNAKKYSDAEDFYDDHYEDFDDYEDAENYYDDYGYW